MHFHKVLTENIKLKPNKSLIYAPLLGDFLNAKFKMQNAKFRNCVAIIDKLRWCEVLSSLSALADREGKEHDRALWAMQGV